MLRFLLSALVLGVCVTAAQAEDLPQTVAEWRQAAWTRLAQLSNIPPEVVDKPGTYQAEVTIIVRRDGSVARSELAQSCGKDELDENALRLAHMASPLPPLPPLLYLPPPTDGWQRGFAACGFSPRRHSRPLSRQ